MGERSATTQLNEDALLSVRDLYVSLGRAEIVRGVSFSVRAGELACILGAYGSGKTTTLRAILGLVSPTQGDILVEGTSTLGLSDLARARIFAYVPQASEPPFPYLVKDVVMLGRTPHLRGSQVPGTRDEKVARNAMARMGILGIAARPSTWSTSPAAWVGASNASAYRAYAPKAARGSPAV